MTEQEMRKGGGGKLSRSETVTVRLDPRLRYLAELAARLHRRTLSSYVEWAIETSLENNVLKPDVDGRGNSIKDDAEHLWDVDEADRFVKLALRYPNLLTHEEQVRWKLIRELPGLWIVAQRSMDFRQLRIHWKDLCAVADGLQPRSSLPPWLLKSTADDFEDDIPF